MGAAQYVRCPLVRRRVGFRLRYVRPRVRHVNVDLTRKNSQLGECVVAAAIAIPLVMANAPWWLVVPGIVVGYVAGTFIKRLRPGKHPRR